MHTLNANDELAIRKYGGIVYDKQSLIAIANVGDEVAKPNPERVGFIITNLTSSSIVISLNRDLSKAYQMSLTPNGGSISFNGNDDGALCGTGVYGQTAGVGVQLHILEIIRQNVRNIK